MAGLSGHLSSRRKAPLEKRLGSMLELIATTLHDILFGWTLFYLLLGVFLGLVIGVLPSLGTTAGMALLIPFVYGMEMKDGIAVMVGLLAVVPTGDTVMSVLIGIPGGGSSQATVLDGFPMAKKGEAGRALSAAYASSLIGGVFGAVVLTGAILIARPLVLAFGTGELLLLTILGITMVSVLSGASLLKGLIACGIGMMLASIGSSPATGQFRMIIGNWYYLGDGLPLAAVALAVFAVPEVVDLLRCGQAISDRPPIRGGWLRGLIDTWQNRWLVFRCSILGCIIGALPIGGSDWFAYGHAVQTCKPREDFGKGDVRGVIAPEAANNANTGGALVPTLIFGIPGSSSTAVFLGGLILLGVKPGPQMVDTYLGLTYTVIWSLALANIVGAGICFMISGAMAKVTAIRFVYMAPFLLAVIFFGAFQSSRQWGDLVTLFLVGVFAVYMKRFGFPRPAFVIGFVLQEHIEILLYQVVQIYTLEDLAARPLIWVLLALNVLSLVFGLRNRPVFAVEGTSLPTSRSQVAPQVIFNGLIMLMAVYCIVDASRLSMLSKVFPITVSAITFICVALGLNILLRNPGGHPFAFDSEIGGRERNEGYRTSLLYYVYWIAGLMLGIYLVGFVLALVLFFVVFLRTQSDARWGAIVLMTASMLAVLSACSYFLVLEFPSGLLQKILPLPWPFE
jgi:putative tricarboxylic transport membrane protein